MSLIVPNLKLSIQVGIIRINFYLIVTFLQEKMKESANQTPNQKNQDGSDADIDVENNDETESETVDPITGKAQAKTMSALALVSKKIHFVRARYANLIRLAKNGSCYSRYCNMSSTVSTNAIATQNLTSTCYSPNCLQIARLKRELVVLLKKANMLNNVNSPQRAIARAVVKVSESESKDVIKKEVPQKEDKVDGEVPAKAIKLENSLDVKTEVKTEPVEVDSTSNSIASNSVKEEKTVCKVEPENSIDVTTADKSK